MQQEEITAATQYMLYVIKPQDMRCFDAALNERYSSELWEARMHKLLPKSLFKSPFLVWLILHYLGFFKSSDYSIFTIHQRREMIHYSVVLPKYFRTPFMAEGDLQIGPCWTHEEHRRKGIASYAIQEILELYRGRNRKFWYIVRKENFGSRMLAEKAGFELYGKAAKKRKFGILAFAVFHIAEKHS